MDSGAQASIDSLPPELIAKIFLMAAAEDPPRPPRQANVTLGADAFGDDGGDGYQEDTRPIPGEGDLDKAGELGGAVRYSHVSRRWRGVALDEARLWVHIGYFPQDMDTFVGRTKTYPLHLTLHGSASRADIRVAIEYLREHPAAALRVTHLTIYEHRRNAFSRSLLGQLRQCAFVNVRELLVVANECEYKDNGGGVWTEREFQYLPLPSLSRAEITNAEFTFGDAPLCELTMTAREKEHEDLDDYDMKLIKLLPFLGEYSQWLRFLCLDYPGFEPHSALREMPRILFKVLKVLIYRDELFQPPSADENTVADFFHHVSYPANTVTSLSLAFPDLSSLDALPSVMKSMQAAGTPHYFGLQVRVTSPRSFVLVFHAEPWDESIAMEGGVDDEDEEMVDEEEDESETDEDMGVSDSEDATMADDGESDYMQEEPVVDVCFSCDIGVWYGGLEPTGTILRRAVHGFLDARVLEVVSSEHSYYEAVRLLFPTGTSTRWVQP